MYIAHTYLAVTSQTPCEHPPPKKRLSERFFGASTVIVMTIVSTIVYTIILKTFLVGQPALAILPLILGNG